VASLGGYCDALLPSNPIAVAQPKTGKQKEYNDHWSIFEFPCAPCCTPTMRSARPGRVGWSLRDAATAIGCPKLQAAQSVFESVC